MFRRERTKQVSCPHCGSSQSEPKGIISTYCRTCGNHFSVDAPVPETVASVTFSGSPASAQITGPRLACFSCGHVQNVVAPAGLAPCRRCGADFDLRAVDIRSHSTRCVSTHGELRVSRRAFLNSTRIQCGSAQIDGRVAGKVTCSGELRMSGSEVCKARIESVSLIVERGASLKFLYPLVLNGGWIDGRVEADVVCTGTLRIGRHGVLLGDVDARSLIVDRGGIFSGSVRVAASLQKAEDLDPPAERATEVPIESAPWLPGMALGAA